MWTDNKGQDMDYVECIKCKNKDKMTEMSPYWNLFEPVYPPNYICKSCQPERSKREDYKVTTITSYDLPKIEMPIDKDILTKYKFNI